MAGALIVTAELASPDFAWLNDLRRRYYPAERNRVPAHLTMFHAIIPSAESEIRQILRTMEQLPAPRAWIAGVMDLSGGVALRVTSEELDEIRREIAVRLHGLLTAQDTAGWSAHITVQNKVAPSEAKALIKALGDVRRPLGISGLGVHRYLDGPWETIRTFRFRG
jgi:2'-5' RNA ligase superfamily